MTFFLLALNIITLVFFSSLMGPIRHEFGETIYRLLNEYRNYIPLITNIILIINLYPYGDNKWKKKH